MGEEAIRDFTVALPKAAFLDAYFLLKANGLAFKFDFETERQTRFG